MKVLKPTQKLAILSGLIEGCSADELSNEERFGALLMAMDASGLPRSDAQVALMRKYWQQCVDARQARRKSS